MSDPAKKSILERIDDWLLGDDSADYQTAPRAPEPAPKPPEATKTDPPKDPATT